MRMISNGIKSIASKSRSIITLHYVKRRYYLCCKELGEISTGTDKVLNGIRLHNVQFMWTGRYGPKSIKKLKVQDKIPKNYELVYRNPMTNYLNYAQMTCIALGLGIGTVILFPPTVDMESVSFGPKTKSDLVIAYVGLTIAFICIQYVALKFPVRIYSDGPNYIVVKHGLLGSVRTKQIAFKAGECSKSKPSIFSIWNDVRYTINHNRSDLYILEHHFKTNADYNRMLGIN